MNGLGTEAASTETHSSPTSTATAHRRRHPSSSNLPSLLQRPPEHQRNRSRCPFGHKIACIYSHCFSSWDLSTIHLTCLRFIFTSPSTSSETYSSCYSSNILHNGAQPSKRTRLRDPIRPHRPQPIPPPRRQPFHSRQPPRTSRTPTLTRLLRHRRRRRLRNIRDPERHPPTHAPTAISQKKLPATTRHALRAELPRQHQERTDQYASSDHHGTGSTAPTITTGNNMELRAIRVEALEPREPVQGKELGRWAEEVVVGSQ
jgi:hypothetical protein